jgi:hypothetical protein
VINRICNCGIHTHISKLANSLDAQRIRAPKRMLQGLISMPANPGMPVLSTNFSGRITSSFIRSSKVCRRQEFTAGGLRSGCFSYAGINECEFTHCSACLHQNFSLANSGHDVRVGCAAAEISAHEFTASVPVWPTVMQPTADIIWPGVQ